MLSPVIAGAAREHRMGKFHQPHSAPKARSPQSQWAGRAAAGQSPAEATQLSPVGAWLPSAILPTLAVLHSIPIVGVLMEMLLNRELESGDEIPGERI